MRFAKGFAAVGGLLVLAPAASAATLTADRRCYQETQEVVLRGEGYRPGSTITVSRDGDAIGSATVNSEGRWAGKFASRRLPRGRREALYDLSASDGSTSAVTRYRVTKVFADFAPSRGNPANLRVRFSINGFSLLRRRAPVYLHYVRPNGRVRRTVRIGTARGTCGLIRRSDRMRLFPFRAERGRWVLQFDTNRRYVRANQNSDFVWVRKPIEVFNRG